MDEVGENGRRATDSRRAKQPMLRIGDAAQRRIGRLEPFGALHFAFGISLSQRYPTGIRGTRAVSPAVSA